MAQKEKKRKKKELFDNVAKENEKKVLAINCKTTECMVISERGNPNVSYIWGKAT